MGCWTPWDGAGEPPHPDTHVKVMFSSGDRSEGTARVFRWLPPTDGMYLPIVAYQAPAPSQQADLNRRIANKRRELFDAESGVAEAHRQYMEAEARRIRIREALEDLLAVAP